MPFNRRAFLRWTAAAGVGVGTAACATSATGAQGDTDRPGGQSGSPERADVPASIRALRPMTEGIVPISVEERRARVAKARRLMAENQIDAVVLEGGSSMFYFTGVRWGLSERPFLLVMPKNGDMAWVCPAFEEERARELIKSPT